MSLQAGAIALDMKSLWGSLRPPAILSSQSPNSCHFISESMTQGPAHSIKGSSHRQNVSRDENSKAVESCQLFLSKLNRACAAFIGWADELEENCVALNDEIVKDKDRYREGAGLR